MSELGNASWRRATWGANETDVKHERGDFDDVDALWVFLIGAVCVGIGALVAAALTGL